MSLNLMTGYAGEPHITSADDGAVNAAIYGASKYVLNTGQKFAYELISNNLIKIKDGYAINQGRKIGQQINDYEELTIDNGLQGVKRSDIIAIRYSKNSDTGIESADFVVIKGTSGDDYKDPTLEVGNIIQGDSVDDLPLYRVKIDGLSITAVEPLFNVLMSMQEMQDEIASNASAIDSLNSNLNNQYVQGGIAQTQNLNGYFRSKHVTFTRAYTSTPTVVATVLNYQNNVADASITTLVKNASKTGVDVYVAKSDGGLENQGYEISWIAIGSIN